MALRFFLVLIFYFFNAFSHSPFRFGLTGECLAWRGDLSSQWLLEPNGRKTPLDFSWRPGFRVGASYIPMRTEVIWTHYEGQAEKKKEMNTSFVGALTGKWHLNLDAADLQFSCPIFLNYAVFRPFFGARGLSLKHRSELDQLEELLTVTTFRSRYQAGGIRLGSDVTLTCCRTLGLYFKGAYSLLYGNFHNKQEVMQTDFEEVDAFQCRSLSLFSSRQMTEIAVGLFWSPANRPICNPLVFRIAFEQWIFPFQWVNEEREGQLSVYGPSFSLDFFF